LTRNDLETQALSKVKLIQMAKEIKEGEERLTGGEEPRNELRRLLGMGSDGVVVGVKALKATARHSAAGNGRRRLRRVGERNAVRDAVGAVRNGG
jgi:hypothetical protein